MGKNKQKVFKEGIQHSTGTERCTASLIEKMKIQAMKSYIMLGKSGYHQKTTRDKKYS